MSDPFLQQRFDFNESDLHANRNGRLSQRQVDRILSDARNNRPVQIGCGFGLILISLIFPIGFAPLMWEVRTELIALLGILCGVLVWLGAWGLIGIGMIRSALRPPSLDLASVSGPVNIVGVERRTSGDSPTTYTAYELRVGGKSFDVDAELGNLIMQGDEYAVYYIEGTGRIMSLERFG